MTTQLCRRCRFHPASDRIFGYCSWDCHDADADAEAEDEQDHQHQHQHQHEHQHQQNDRGEAA